MRMTGYELVTEAIDMLNSTHLIKRLQKLIIARNIVYARRDRTPKLVI